MGNKQSHDVLNDGEEKGTLRDFLKSKSPTLSSSGKRNSKVDETDGVRRMSNNSSNSSDRDVSITEQHLEAASPESATPNSKPDGITKLAKVSIKQSSLLLFL